MKYEIEEKNCLGVHVIHTKDRDNKPLANLLSTINGVKTAYTFFDYVIEIRVAKLFNDDDVLREIKSKVHLFYNTEKKIKSSPKKV
jgi:hypothetical protein